MKADFRRFSSSIAILKSRTRSSFEARACSVKTLGLGVIDQAQIFGEVFGRSEPVPDCREEVPVEFRQIVFAQFP